MGHKDTYVNYKFSNIKGKVAPLQARLWPRGGVEV
jgi:hypothetical protein